LSFSAAALRCASGAVPSPLAAIRGQLTLDLVGSIAVLVWWLASVAPEAVQGYR